MISGVAGGRIRRLPRRANRRPDVVAASAYAEMPEPDVGAMTAHAPAR
jgi:hypothetical protein